MQAILLAAGMGKRLGKYTKNQTKCMVEVNGRKIIEYTIESLINANIKRLIVVIGYKGEKLQKFILNHIKEKNYDINVIFVENKIYDKTNNIYSLWLTKDYLLKDDTILLESDIIFDNMLIKRLVEDKRKNLCVVSKFNENMDGTVVLLKNNNIIESFINKQLFDWNQIDKYYKTVNIYKFSKQFLKRYYLPFLESYIKVFGNNIYYEQVLEILTNIKKFNLQAFIIDNDKWFEIDDYQDLDIASIYFSNEKEKLEKLEKRYGGYWRFKEITDYCYLVNPYFPTTKMSIEIEHCFASLLANYPSGIEIQNLLAARLFNIDKNHIVVGNGASEFIKIIMENINDIYNDIFKNELNRKIKIGIILPTFNEYEQRLVKLNNIEIKYFNSSKTDFIYKSKEVIKFLNEIDVLILINPDNPSGNFIEIQELNEILKFSQQKNKMLIIDESFIDFADKDKRYSLIKDNIIEKYKNIIIVKSISKSYGVPGIRLGVIASSNKKIINFMKKELPIWNINSFAEKFLQIIPKYLKEYVNSCNLITSERDKFFNELKKIDFLKVYKSQANYFICKLKNDIDSEYLVKTFLNKYNILLKNLKTKKGLENKNYIRIAIRTRKENKHLIDCFKDFKKNL